MKIHQIMMHGIAILPKIHSVKSLFLPKSLSAESPFILKIHSVELMIR